MWDVGGAEGSLAMELAKRTRATVYVVDLDPAAVRLCNLLADEAKLTGRVRAIEGDAQNSAAARWFRRPGSEPQLASSSGRTRSPASRKPTVVRP